MLTRESDAAVPVSDGSVADAGEAALAAALAATRPGEVLSYAELARRAGRPRGARWAARWLAGLPAGHRLPWHRVVRADGRIALPADSPAHAEQVARLRAEGVSVVGARVQLRLPGPARPRGPVALDAWVFGEEAGSGQS